MTETRPEQCFFGAVSPKTAGELAGIADGELRGNSPDAVIRGAATLNGAREGDIAFLANRKYRSDARETKASLCIVTPDTADALPEGVSALIHPSPQYAFALALSALYPGYHTCAPSLADKADIADSAVIEQGAVICEGAVIGEECRIGANSVIGRGCRIGARTVIAPNCTVECALIGEDCVLFSGARVGQEGFGFATDEKGRHITVPQIGGVTVGNRVTIGANSCIDRGALEPTRIEDDVRIDNLVQIGHNVIIERGAVIVAQVGVAGSTRIGAYSVLAGQSGVAGHLTLGPKTVLAAQTGVAQDLEGNGVYGGTPAVPMPQYHRQHLFLKKIVTAGKNRADKKAS